MSKLTKNEMRGSMFKVNKEKENQPDYQGNCLIDGRHYWMAGWIEEWEGGKRLAIQFKVAEQQEL